MCGIYGYVGIKPDIAPHLARALCLENESRGEDSCGIATVNPDCVTTIVKSVGAPKSFIRRPDVCAALAQPHTTLIGHTRYATHGEVSKRNAHPFLIGATVGVHNGVVANLAAMRAYTGQEFAVDSQYLVWCLDKHGHMGPASGALNVAYFGKKDAADLRLIRYGNPLAYVVLPDQSGFVFSSEGGALRRALSIVGLRGKIHEFGPGKSCAAYYDAAHGKISFRNGEAPFGPAAEMAQYRAIGEPKKTWFSAAWNCSAEDWRDRYDADDSRNARPKKIGEMTDAEWRAYIDRDQTDPEGGKYYRKK